MIRRYDRWPCWLLVSLSFSIAAGCGLQEEPPYQVATCAGEIGPEEPVMSGAAALLSPQEPIDLQPARISGTTDHLGDLAITSVTVAGEPAITREGAFNFGRWEAEVPWEKLRALAREQSGGDPEATSATLDVVALDACGRSRKIDEVDVEITIPGVPFIDPDTLDVLVRYPRQDVSYLPVDQIVPAVIEVRANVEAVGAEVTLRATSGRFGSADRPMLAAVDPQVTLQLTRQPGGQVAAQVLFYAEEPGVILLTAEAREAVASASLRAAGAPVLVPSSAELPPGTRLLVELLGEARLQSCEAGDVADIRVTSGGLDLAQGPVQQLDDADGDRLPDFSVLIDPLTVFDASVTGTCRDVYGQLSTGVYTARVP